MRADFLSGLGCENCSGRAAGAIYASGVERGEVEVERKRINNANAGQGMA